MPKFEKNSIVELKSFLYNSWVHDAKIESVHCDYGNERLEISLFNSYASVKIDIIFHNVEFTLSVKGQWHGDREEIIGITAEDDFSYLEKYLPNHSEYHEDSLYLLFQMFSGDELHIISKEVMIACTEDDSVCKPL